MASRKKDKEKTTGLLRQEEIIQRAMEEVMHDSMIPYSEHVIMERALPRVEDGLKPVQRRILFTMHELGNTSDKPHRKCARIVGDCLGKYHPHGDSSVYDALTRMAQPFVMRGMLVDGHGNFGSIDGDSPAAMRYTEARMMPLAEAMLNGIDKDTVSFHLNFDDTQKEPDLLPAHFPNLLVNGANGIAVGLATSIPPHNLGEVIDGTIAKIDNPKITTKELMQYIPAPDFPTGGIIACDEELFRAYDTGRGKLQVRAKLHIEQGTGGRSLIVIDEVPYQVNKAAMLEKILRLSEEKKNLLGGIYDIRDESDRTGMRAVIECRKDSDPEAILNVLYKYSDLQTTFGANIVAIAGGKPVQMGLGTVLEHFITHEKQVVTRRTKYDLQQAEARAHILEGLIIAVDNLDEVIRLIRSSKTPKEARQKLVERFALTEIQAQAILDMRLQRLTNLEVLALRQEYAELEKKIAQYKAILASEKKLLAVIKKEMTGLKERFADPRRTQMVGGFEAAEIKIDEPEPEDVRVLETSTGFMKRMTPKAFDKALAGGEFKDPIKRVIECASNEKLLFITTAGNCYSVAAEQIPEARPKDRGTAPGALLAGLAADETPIAILTANGFSGEILLATAGGMIKRTAMEELDVRKKCFPIMKLKDGDRVVFAAKPEKEDELLLISKSGMAIHFALEEVSVVGRGAAGVRSMTLADGDEVGFVFLHRDEGEVVLSSELGYLKRCLLIDFDRQSRGGKGVKCMGISKNGQNGSYIAGALLVTMPYDFRIVQKNGGNTVFNTEDVPIERKSGKGNPYVVVVMGDVVTGLERQ